MNLLSNLTLTEPAFFRQLGLIIFLLVLLLAALHFLSGIKRGYGWGKIGGFILGYFVARAPGAVVGLIFGHAFDLYAQPRSVSPTARQPVSAAELPSDNDNALYYATLFAILGQLSRAGGALIQMQSSPLQTFMQQLHLAAESRRNAWAWFAYGQQQDFNLQQALFTFNHYPATQAQQIQQLMRQIVSYAASLPAINSAQYAILCQLAAAWNFSTENFAHLVPQEQKRYNRSATNTAGSDPYTVLNVAASASNKEIKSAYRKLMGRYHPDRLISKDLPEDLIQLATQRTQAIKEAYEKICQARGI